MHSLEAMLAVGDVTGDGVWHQTGDPAGRPRARAGTGVRRPAAGALRPGLVGRPRATTATGPTTRSSPTARPSGTAWSGPGCCSSSRPRLGEAAPAGLLDDARACSSTVRSPTAGTSTARRASSTRPTGTADPSCASGCTGCWPRASRPPPRCTARTGEDRPTHERYAAWWAYARDAPDRPRAGVVAPRARRRTTGRQASVWPGKPDLYHAVQATLLPRLPLAPSLARGGGDVGRAPGTGMMGA